MIAFMQNESLIPAYSDSQRDSSGSYVSSQVHSFLFVFLRVDDFVYGVLCRCPEVQSASLLGRTCCHEMDMEHPVRLLALHVALIAM